MKKVLLLEKLSLKNAIDIRETIVIIENIIASVVIVIIIPIKNITRIIVTNKKIDTLIVAIDIWKIIATFMKIIMIFITRIPRPRKGTKLIVIIIILVINL